MTRHPHGFERVDQKQGQNENGQKQKRDVNTNGKGNRANGDQLQRRSLTVVSDVGGDGAKVVRVNGDTHGHENGGYDSGYGSESGFERDSAPDSVTGPTGDACNNPPSANDCYAVMRFSPRNLRRSIALCHEVLGQQQKGNGDAKGKREGKEEEIKIPRYLHPGCGGCSDPVLPGRDSLAAFKKGCDWLIGPDDSVIKKDEWRGEGMQAI